MSNSNYNSDDKEVTTSDDSDKQNQQSSQTGDVKALNTEAEETTGQKNKTPKTKTQTVSRIIISICMLLVVVLGLYMLQQAVYNKKLKDEMETITKQSAELITQYKYDEAIGIWQEFLEKSMNAEIKCEANTRYSDVLVEGGKYGQANKLYYEVKENCSDIDEYTLYLGLARSYEGLGVIQSSIDNYEKVIAIEKERQQNPPEGFDKAQSEKNVELYNEIVSLLRVNLR